MNFRKNVSLKNNIYIFSLFLFFVLFCIYIFYFNFSRYPTSYIEKVCGSFPQNHVSLELIDNPNYIFEKDFNYSPVQLWDKSKNSVIVNSLLECEHYYLSGWNYKNNNGSFSEQLKCLELLPLRSNYSAQDKFYIKDLSVFDFIKDFNFLCIGRIDNVNIDNDIKKVFIFASRGPYVFFSQIFPLFSLIFLKKLNMKISIPFLIFYQLFVQLIFNYQLDFTILNNVSYFGVLIMVIYLMENNEKTNKQ